MSVNADRTQLLASNEAVADTVVATIKDAANNAVSYTHLPLCK